MHEGPYSVLEVHDTVSVRIAPLFLFSQARLRNVICPRLCSWWLNPSLSHFEVGFLNHFIILFPSL